MLQADRLVGESVEVKSAFGHLAFGFLCHRTVLVSPSGSKIGFRLPSPFDRPSSFRLPRLQLQLQPFGCLTPSTLLIQLVWSCRFSIYLLCLQTRFRFTLLLDVVPFVLLVCQTVDLGVDSLGFQWCSPRYPLSRCWASSRWQAPGCGGTSPQYAFSSHGTLDSEWGVLRFESRTIGSASDGRFGYWPKNQPIVICNHMASFAASC